MPLSSCDSRSSIDYCMAYFISYSHDTVLVHAYVYMTSILHEAQAAVLVWHTRTRWVFLIMIYFPGNDRYRWLRSYVNCITAVRIHEHWHIGVFAVFALCTLQAHIKAFTAGCRCRARGDIYTSSIQTWAWIVPTTFTPSTCIRVPGQWPGASSKLLHAYMYMYGHCAHSAMKCGGPKGWGWASSCHAVMRCSGPLRRIRNRHTIATRFRAYTCVWTRTLTGIEVDVVDRDSTSAQYM